MKLFRNLKALTRWAIRNNETGPSSNGRTLVFGTSYVGSNPAGPASLKMFRLSSYSSCLEVRIRTDEVD